GLPLLEEQLDLPAEPIEPGDKIERKRRARQVGAEPGHRRLVTRQHDDTERVDLLAALVLDVEIHPAASVLRDELGQPNWRAQRESLAVEPGCIYPGIVAAAEPDDEASPVFVNLVEVRGARVSAVCEQQSTCERRGFWEELALLFAVGRDLDRAHLVREAAV